MKIFGAGIMAGTGFLFSCGYAFAEGIDLGPCKLYPVIKTEERYEDNIFQMPSNAKSELVNTTTPEILLKFKLSGKNIFDVNYKYEMINFDKYSSDNRRNNKFKAALELYGSSYFFKLKDQYDEITNTYTYAEYFDNYAQNTVFVSIGRDFNDISFELFYENLDYEYNNIDSVNSRNDHVFDIAGFYNILPKTKALAEYSFTKINYDNSSAKDGMANEFLVGVQGELAQKITGTVKAGYQSRNYDGYTDWKEPVTYANIVYEASEKTLLDAMAERKPLESIDTAQNFYESNIVGFGIRHDVTAKTATYLKLKYNFDRYPATNTDSVRREDDIWNAKIGLDINSRQWLDIGANYEFQKRNSNISSNDYENNITSIYLKAMY